MRLKNTVTPKKSGKPSDWMSEKGKKVFFITIEIFVVFLVALIIIATIRHTPSKNKESEESSVPLETLAEDNPSYTATNRNRTTKSTSSGSITSDKTIVKIQDKNGDIKESDVDWDKLYQDAYTVGDKIPIKNREIYYKFMYQKSVTKASDTGGLIFINTQGPGNIAVLDKVDDWDSEHITIRTSNTEETDNDVLGKYKLTLRIGGNENYFMYSLGSLDTTSLSETPAQLVKWNYKKDKSYISGALTNAQFSDKNTDTYQAFTNTVTLSSDGKILTISREGNTAFYIRENIDSKKFAKKYQK